MDTRPSILAAAMIFAAAATVLPPAASHAQMINPEAADLNEQQALDFSQAAIGRQLGDFDFVDSFGRPFVMQQTLGRPLIINLVYSSCRHACPLIVETLDEAVDAARGALRGTPGFSVLTIGFDTAADTPARMHAFASAHGVGGPDWHFLSADQTTIDRLTRTTGFTFYRSSQGFDHLSQITVVDKAGAIYRQIYGESFDPPLVVEPLKDLVYGRAASWSSVDGLINKIRLFCTIYDPSSNRYRFDYSPFIGLAVGFLALSVIATVLIRAWRSNRASSRNA
ncbi:MAG: SCO family protein [Proteobacteria bacterium]|nr:SCO family protein [Pseudomonadota bacterium]MDA1308751.1 SCO family protein [Pseudomonadota bacterium]